MIEINWTTLNETINNTNAFNYVNQTIIQPLIWDATNYRQNMWLAITGFIAILLAFIFISKRIKKMIENRKYIDLKSKEIMTEFEKLAKNEKVNEIDIRDLPRPVRENILQHESLLSKMFFKSNKEGYKPPFLILIRGDKTAEIKHNAKEGELLIKKKDKEKTQARLQLTTQKLISLKTDKGRQDFWICFENEAEPYPHEPKHHSVIFYQIVHALQMAKMGLTKKGKFPKILLIIGAIVIVGIIIAVWYFNKQAPTEIITPVTETVNNTINNTLQNITFKTVKV